MNKLFKLKSKKINLDEFLTKNMHQSSRQLLKFTQRQKNYYTCSIASLIPIINFVYSKKLTSEKELLKSKALRPFLKRFSEAGDNRIWGVSLREFSLITKTVLEEYGIDADLTPIFFKNPKESEVTKYLKGLDHQTFIVANFTSNFGIGHFSPVGGFDKKLGLVLIADTFHPEPYFVSVSSFIKGCSTKDGNSYRGILRIRINNHD